MPGILRLGIKGLAERYQGRFPFVLTFLALGGLWAVANWPALHDAWWFSDDYSLADTPWSGAWRLSLGLGRPILALWWWTYDLDRNPDAVLANILLRWLQGGLHVLAATVLASMLWKEIRSRWAVLVVVPFVVWPFNAEVVLWRGAGINVLASLFSILGVGLIRTQGPRRLGWWIGGMALVALSMNTTQGSAMGGLVAWAVLFVLAAVRGEGVVWKQWVREGTLISIGYVLGGLLSVCLTRISPWPNERAVLADNLLDKLVFLEDLNWLFLFHPTLYPTILKYAHLLLVAGTMGLLLQHGSTRTGQGWQVRWHSLFVLACLGSCLVLPYLTNLLVRDNWPALRTFYHSPLFVTACFVTAFYLTKDRLGLRRGYLLLLVLIVGLYVAVGRRNAAEYVLCEQYDRMALGKLEQLASAQGTNKVEVLLPFAPVRHWNPYGLRYNFCESHASAFTIIWSVKSFITRHSSLQIVGDEVLRARALHQVEQIPPRERPQFFKIDGCDVIAVCP